MNSKTLLIILIVVSAFLLNRCEQANNSDISQIKYGTSFGECMGYCKKDISLTPELISYNQESWIDTLTPITCSENIEATQWNNLMNEINTDKFLQLPETIGCPDCADGGAEWIELSLKDGTKHKSTFEYMHEPDAVKAYIEALRDIMSKANECGNLN
jgi:hypothetical protein